MPPLSSSRTGPPQKLGRQAAKPTTSRLQHTALERRTPRSRSHRPVGRRLPAAAYPRESGKNPSHGPVIYRPHPHPKHGGFGVSGTFSPTPRQGRQSGARSLPRPERTAARSARGRQPFKYGTARVAILMVERFGPAGAPPARRASSTAGGVLALREQVDARPGPPADGETRKDPAPPTARVQAASRGDGREDTAGFVDPNTGEIFH